jgi:hypothetical protein
MAALVAQGANLAPVVRAFADFVHEFHGQLSCAGSFSVIVDWQTDSKTRIDIMESPESKKMSCTLELRMNGSALNIDVLKPNQDADTTDVLSKYIAHLQARLGTQRDMQVVRIINDAKYVSFCCMNPSDGAKGVQGIIMLHMWHLVAGALMVCWRPMPKLYDFLRLNIQFPPSEAQRVQIPASLEAAGGGPGPACAPNHGKRAASQDNVQDRQVVQKVFDPRTSGVFHTCQSMPVCLAMFKRLFPDVVDFNFRGDYIRKQTGHKELIRQFLFHMEALWVAENPGSSQYPLHDRLLDLSKAIEKATTLHLVITANLYPPDRGFSLLTDNLKFLSPSVSDVAEKEAWTVKSGAQIDELKRELKPVFEQAMGEAWSNHIRDNTKRLSMAYETTSQGLKWVIRFGVDRREILNSEQLEAYRREAGPLLLDPKGYAWRQTAELVVQITFSTAKVARIIVNPRIWQGELARLPTTLCHHVSLRCRCDCPDLWPSFTEIEAGGGVGVKMEVQYPYMLHIRHIQSVVTSLLAIVTNDRAQLGTDGPGIFHVPAPVPAGDGGPGN